MHNSSKTKPFSPRKRAESSANYQKNAKRKRTQSNSLKKVAEDADCIKIMLGDGESATVLNDLRQRGQLCDGVIKTEEGKEFKIHRAVVSAVSPYFRALFTNTLSGVETTEVTVPSLKSEILTLILDYAYTGNVNVTKSNVEELLPAADLTQVTGVVQQCCDYLAKDLRIENCVGIYLVAKHYFCPALEAAAKNFVMIHFTMTSRISSEFPHLSFDDLINILRSDDLNVSNETDVFKAIIRWTHFNSRERHRYLSNLLTTVRFPR